MSTFMRQDLRLARLTTPLGPDMLVITRFDGTTGLSELSEFRIEALSSRAAIDFGPALGRNVTVTLVTFAGEERHFDGILTEARWIGIREDAAVYHLTLRPWLWLLSQSSDSRIFSNKSVPTIIAEIFQDFGFADFVDSLSGSYPTLEYCVQYRETHLAFVCRLMEEYGIDYFFRHGPGEHKLVLADGLSSYYGLSPDEIPYIGHAGRNQRPEEHLDQWIPERRFTTGRTTFRDYDFKKPSARMEVTAKDTGGHESDDLEHYDYPGRYVETSDGRPLAEYRLQSVRTEDQRFMAAGVAPSMSPGGLVKLRDLPDPAQAGEYLVVRATHAYTAQSYRTGGGADPDQIYEGSYEFQRSDKPHRPPAVTPKARVGGPQTAKVVGDGEIDVDEYGRILVRFHWDRRENASRRCRVAQVWGGKRWGGIVTPRIGMEVVVDFLEGDPDQPLVVGCVYNQENMPPYDLPDQKNLSGLKSNSTPGGDGYNELVFDDTAGSELVRFHAEKNLDSLVENDEAREVKHDRSTTIGHDDSSEVGNVYHLKAENKIELIVGQSKIVMTKDEIKIESMKISIKAAQSLKTFGGMADHKAAAVMTINALPVKINC